jgi:hypothetical protein
MNEQQRKQRTQGFYISGLTTLAYVIFNVAIRGQALSTLYYVMIAVSMICLLVGAYFTFTSKD